MPKKPDACWKCFFDTVNCTNKRCIDCQSNLIEPVYTTEYGNVYCKCLTVKSGEECLYYKEDTNGTLN